MFLLILLMFCGVSLYGSDQHQVYMYTGVGYSQQILDTKDNIYDTISIGTGLGYRWNKFLSKESINYFSIGFSLGGGILFPKLRGNQSILNYNSFLELELFSGYGVGFGANKQHQLSILGISFLPKFYGVLERNNYTQIGGTQVEWYKGRYIPVSIGIYLPSYRYIYNRFFVGFQHSVNILVFGNQNINIPKDKLILRSFGYQFKLEFGLNYDMFSSAGTGQGLEKTTVFIETNRNNILISLFVKAKKEESKFMTIEVFALNEQQEQPKTENLIGYASKIPIYNGQAQFTKHWKDSKNIFEEKIKNNKELIYILIKELDKENKLLITHDLYKNLVEAKNEES